MQAVVYTNELPDTLGDGVWVHLAANAYTGLQKPCPYTEHGS